MGIIRRQLIKIKIMFKIKIHFLIVIALLSNIGFAQTNSSRLTLEDIYQNGTYRTKGYHDGSPLYYAANLKGKLMIIHGTGDDNVHYQNFEMLVNELIKNNKQFDMMSYPMRSHGINERENTSLHLRKTMERFWKNNL